MTRMKQLTLPLLLLAVCVFCNPAPVINIQLEEQGGFFEGDLNLTPTQIRDLFVNNNAGLLSTNRRWNRDNNGIVNVPYTISRNAPYCEYFEDIIWIHFRKDSRLAMF